MAEDLSRAVKAYDHGDVDRDWHATPAAVSSSANLRKYVLDGIDLLRFGLRASP